MKKFYSLYVLVAIFFAACSPPQVTVTLPPAPAPTPTPHPKFAALQQTIAASGTRYTLNGGDGLIYDGETPIPGVTVAPDGTMSLIVSGETVTLDPADVNFDDQDGISIDGYDFHDTDADGNPDSWVEVNETVTMGGVTLTLDENGVMTDMEATGADADTKAENLAKVDPAAWGCENCEIMKIDGKIFITPAGEPDTHMAEWGYDINGWKWNYKLYEETLFENFAKISEMNNGKPKNRELALSDSAKLAEFARMETEGLRNSVRRSVYIFEGETRSKAILGYFIQLNVANIDNLPVLPREYSEVLDGYLCFLTDQGEVKMWFDDIRVHGGL